MSKIINKDCDEDDTGLRFHISSARMGIKRLSFVAFQRYLDRVNKSMYRCRACGWGGSGDKLMLVETDENDVFTVLDEAYSWYACPHCEEKIDIDKPIVSLVD
ncbi:MAG: hypothetical protein Q8N30_02990 [Methylococcales bacterium]|nr:hypothetical protein [Methylococcales bacterium]